MKFVYRETHWGLGRPFHRHYESSAILTIDGQLCLSYGSFQLIQTMVYHIVLGVVPQLALLLIGSATSHTPLVGRSCVSVDI